MRLELADRGIDLGELPSRSRVFLEQARQGRDLAVADIQRELELLLEHLPEEGLGLHTAARISIADYDAFGHALLSSPDLRAAHRIVLSYRKVLRVLHEIEFSYGPKVFTSRIKGMKVHDRPARFFTECWLQTHFRFTGIFLGISHPFLRISLAYDRPPDYEIYEKTFDCPVEFGAEYSGYQASSELLGTRFRFANEEVRRFCQERCEALLANMDQGSETVNRARRSLLLQPGWFPDSDEMARALSMSPRTFRRRLKDENSGYREILESVRKELAINYLQQTNLTVEDIAHRLGFVEPNSFYKAFRRWHGSSPRSFTHANLK